MGREVKRMPMGFHWPLKETWWGFLLPAVPCQLCGGSGKRPKPGPSLWGDHQSKYCLVCEGEGETSPRINIPEWEPKSYDPEPPPGIGWQMWETTSEGSPISPVCETPEALARWLADNKASAFGRETATYDEWLRMIRGTGSAVSAVMTSDGRFLSGVAAISLPEK